MIFEVLKKTCSTSYTICFNTQDNLGKTNAWTAEAVTNWQNQNKLFHVSKSLYVV